MWQLYRWGRVTAIFLSRESAISKYYMSRVTAQLFSQTLVSRLRLNILFVCSCPLRNATGKNRQQQSLSESALFSDKQFNLSQPFFRNATQIGNIKQGLSESSAFHINNSNHLQSWNTTGRNNGASVSRLFGSFSSSDKQVKTSRNFPFCHRAPDLWHRVGLIKDHVVPVFAKINISKDIFVEAQIL